MAGTKKTKWNVFLLEFSHQLEEMNYNFQLVKIKIFKGFQIEMWVVVSDWILPFKTACGHVTVLFDVTLFFSMIEKGKVSSASQ